MAERDRRRREELEVEWGDELDFTLQLTGDELSPRAREYLVEVLAGSGRRPRAVKRARAGMRRNERASEG